MREHLIGLAALLALASPVSAQPPERLDFAVVVTLSDRARAKLADPAEGVVVRASYYGDPTPAAAQHADETGQIALAAEAVTLPPTGGTAQLTGAAVDKAHLAWVAGPARVTVNVYSARQTGPDNLLACDFFDGALADATAAPLALRCSLIEEKAATKAKP